MLCEPGVCMLPAPLSMEFSRQEYQSGLPFPSPGDLPDSGVEPGPPVLAGGFFTTEKPGKPVENLGPHKNLCLSVYSSFI